MDIKTETKILVEESLDKRGAVDAKRVAVVCDYIEANASAESKLRLLKGYMRALKPLLAKNSALIESSGEIDAGTLQNLKKFVEKHTGREGIEFTHQVNADLLGGLRIRCGDDIWEFSAADALKQSLDR